MRSTCGKCGVVFDSPRGRAYCTPSHRASAWAEANAEKVRARKAMSHTTRREGVLVACVHCGEEFRARRADAKYCSTVCRSRECRLRDPEGARARGRRWAARNPQSASSWQSVNREKAAAVKRESRRRRVAANPDAARAEYVRHAQLRRAREADVVNIPFSHGQLVDRYAVFGFRCWICGRDDVQLHMDHVKPISKGGAHMLANIRPACKPCNSRKRDAWGGPREAATLAGTA